jgi:predicted dehydrogenase
VGVAGGWRGGGYVAGIRALRGRAELHAVYDPNADLAAAFAGRHGVDVVARSFAELLEQVDAVVLASPQQHHAPQAALALERGVHVLSEVPAAVSFEQAFDLLAAVRTSDAGYMLAENYCYTRNNLVVREMARARAFGDLYFGESEYLHEMKSYHRTEAGQPTWRYFWQVGRDGHTYPTHSLGPLLQWMDDRIVALSCVGTGRHTDPEHEIQDTVALSARTRKGALIRVRLDLLSNRPHLMDYYSLQGTEGAYEAPRAGTQAPRVYLHGKTEGLEWEPLDRYVDEFLPDRFRHPPEGAGHWGSDAWPIFEFVDAVTSGRRPPIDVYSALDMTLPGIVSERSIAANGSWLAVPDPRTWTAGIGVDPGREAPLT